MYVLTLLSLHLLFLCVVPLPAFGEVLELALVCNGARVGSHLKWEYSHCEVLF